MKWFYKQTGHAIQTLQHALSISTFNYYREWSRVWQSPKALSLPASEGGFLWIPAKAGLLSAHCSHFQSSRSWNILFFFWYKLRLLDCRVAHFQSNNTCIACHQPQVSFHGSNVKKCIHLSLEGKEAAHAGFREFASTVT